jgi:hypothetical protein
MQIPQAAHILADALISITMRIMQEIWVKPKCEAFELLGPYVSVVSLTLQFGTCDNDGL